jgi:hypothetical protein
MKLWKICQEKIVYSFPIHSLLPQLKAAETAREWPAITTHNQGNHAVRSKDWRYIRYADGSEELYNMQIDPREWKNLVHLPEHAAVKQEHRRWLPKVDVPMVAGSASRVLTYDATTDEATWEGKKVLRSDPVPE